MITVTIKGIQELINRLRRTEDAINQGTSIGVSGASQILHREIIRAISEVGAVASGDLLQSVLVMPVSLSAVGAMASVSSNSPYAFNVEYGRRAGSRMPPRDNILKWMIMKGLEPSDSGAYLIARKIARDGIVGKHPFQTGKTRATPLVYAFISQAVASQLRQVYR